MKRSAVPGGAIVAKKRRTERPEKAVIRVSCFVKTMGGGLVRSAGQRSDPEIFDAH